MTISALAGFLVARLAHFIRFSISGLVATGVNYAALWIFLGIVGTLASVTIAFALSTGVNFVLQKYWAYGDVSRETMRRQFALYLLMGLALLGLNDATFWAFAEVIRTNWLLAQIAATGVVAVFGLKFTRRIFSPALQRIQ